VDVDKLAEENYKLVHHFVNKYKTNQWDYDDLVSAGQFGYAKAIKTYDSSKKVKFSSYASTCIINEIRMFMRANRKRLNDTSIDKPISYDKHGNEMTILDTLVTEESEYDWRSINESINHVLGNVKPKHKKTFIFFTKGMTRREIGREMGFTQAYGTKIINGIITKVSEHYWRDH
jgi:RNA polymerase sporulation-specific sigma factor